MVKDIIWGDNWAVPSFFDNQISTLINTIPIEGNDDSHLWLSKLNPKFADFRKHYFSHLEMVNWNKFVWHKRAFLRFSAYAWLAFKGGLKTSDALAKRGISSQYTCCFCHCAAETMSYLFYDCSFTFNVIKCFLPWLGSLLMNPNLFQVYDSIFEQNFNNHDRSLSAHCFCCYLSPLESKKRKVVWWNYRQPTDCHC
ncbi:uncharacterized protein LOC114580786 [Dendrobium catenatum]|uniref:uncharacterized protein LOC114580786 n=1 Tax=Dendrobium catenatum TaxID=906689 RepID=UPI00109F3648|nr:uncharacterized protein LOC114580786 [Dendrobium catenatum]